MANSSVWFVVGLLFLGISFGVGENDSQKLRGPTETKNINIYDFKAKDVHGNWLRLEEFRHQVLLIVNVASECGFTDAHYKALVKLQQVYGSTGKFSVLAFPCNDFGGQEPGSEKEIYEFARTKYNINFPLFSKITITGTPANPIYKFLSETTGQTPNWNFWKYLVGTKGGILNSWGPWVDIQSLTKEVRRAVNDAVMADKKNPNKQASGPPQNRHKDYGDGQGGGQEVWSEGREAQESQEPSRAGASNVIHEDL